MSSGLLLTLLGISLSCCITAYREAATHKGWPYGGIYTTGTPLFIALCCIAVALGRLIFGAINGQFGWWTLILFLPAWFIGGPFILLSLKKWTGPVALIGAPLAAFAALFVH
jgi:hypothetical protein